VRVRLVWEGRSGAASSDLTTAESLAGGTLGSGWRRRTSWMGDLSTAGAR